MIPSTTRLDCDGALNPQRIALVSARAAQNLDEDLAPLVAALGAAGAQARVENWDDNSVPWADYDLALLRSTWDYTMRLPEFLDWAQRTAQLTELLNPLTVLRWNIDKHYVAQLATQGVAVVPSEFVEPAESAQSAIKIFLARYADCAELVVKPCIGAGSRDVQRHSRSAGDAIIAHVQRLLDAGRSAMLQPYLERVDSQGETALIYFSGRFSHAVRKGPLLRPAGSATEALFAAEDISARAASAAELALAERVLSVMPFECPLYARIDLIRDADDRPCVLELEMAEPSLFFAHAPGSAQRFAAAILARPVVPLRR